MNIIKERAKLQMPGSFVLLLCYDTINTFSETEAASGSEQGWDSDSGSF